MYSGLNGFYFFVIFCIQINKRSVETNHPLSKSIAIKPTKSKSTMLIAKEYFSLVFSLNNLYFHLGELLEHGQYRTLMFYYENSTAFVASDVMKIIANKNDDEYALMAFNVDHQLNEYNFSVDVGNELYKVCVFHNLTDLTKYFKLKDQFNFDPRFDNVFISQTNATIEEITHFFQALWAHSVLNAALIFFDGGIRIYTHLPFQGQFAMKVFDEADNQNYSSAEMFAYLFEHNADNLANTTLKVFMMDDPPKTYRVPVRFRYGKKYYFSGRDGIIAHIVEQRVNAQWKYLFVKSKLDIVKFKDSPEAADALGDMAPPDRSAQANVVYLNLTRNFSLV